MLDSVRFEVQSAHDRAAQSREVVRLYEEKILPVSQRNIESAQANYTSGKLDFLRLLDAERQLYSQREMYYQAIAESPSPPSRTGARGGRAGSLIADKVGLS